MFDICKLTTRAAAVLAFAALATGASAQGSGQYQRVVDSTVRIMTTTADGKSYFGTGWVVAAADKDKRAGAAVIVTANHVVADAVKIRIVQPGMAMGDALPASLLRAAPERDMAFLEAKGISQNPLTVTTAAPDAGQELRVMGFSKASDNNENTRADIKIASFSKIFSKAIDDTVQTAVDQVEFDAAISPGFSGGPVVNNCGNVVGLTVRDAGHIPLKDGTFVSVAQGVSVAISSNEIIAAANAAGVTLQTISGACGVTAPPPAANLAANGNQPEAPCLHANVASENGQLCKPISPWQDFMNRLTSRMGIIVAAAALGLLLVAVAAFAIMRQPKNDDTDDGADEARYLPGKGSTLEDRNSGKGASALGAARGSIRLSGTSPSGEPIDLRFTKDKLAGASGIMLGVEGDEGGKIPDNRSNPFVSRFHARLSYDNGSFWIMDNKSLNKTKVGSETLAPFAPRRLSSGDQLTLADVKLHVTIE